MASIAELTDIMARIELTMEENEKKLARERAEIEKGLAESRKETDRRLAESWERTDRAIDRAFEKMAAEHDKSERLMQRLEKNMGGLNNSIGEIVEMIIIPGVIEKMNEFKHSFTVFSPQRVYYDTDNAKLTEVDLLLENCDEVMVVEVKTQVSKKWVERHLKRLEILRKRESITGMRGKTMYAAVAGVNYDADARELAASNGMYLIDINEDSERIDVKPPEKARTW